MGHGRCGFSSFVVGAGPDLFSAVPNARVRRVFFRQDNLREEGLRLLRQSFIRNAVIGAVLIAILLLVSGRVDWVRAWLYAGFVIGFWNISAFIIERSNPGLLEERSRVREGTKSWDRILVAVVGLGTFVMWAVSAADIRAHRPPPVPSAWSVAGFAAAAAGALIMLRAMVINRFFSTTVRIQKDREHQVCDRGPYAHVRHPGYLGASLFTLGSPIALGSSAGVFVSTIVVAVLVLRTVLEDRTLHRELAGYPEYAQRVPWRLIPHLW
jgi:protein-S-isoprenylcysteine O-methyltransferase Ste14